MTCDRGVRYREKKCTSGAPSPPDYLQETETESCGAGNICPQGITSPTMSEPKTIFDVGKPMLFAVKTNHFFSLVSIFNQNVFTQCFSLAPCR